MSLEAIYPGSFDPITNGHVDLVERAAKLFDRIVVGVASNEKKSPLFNLEKRVTLAEKCLEHIPVAEVMAFQPSVCWWQSLQRCSIKASFSMNLYLAA